MFAFFLIALQADGDVLAAYRAKTAAEHRCAPSADSTDITVCGLRDADRFRVAFVAHAPGDPLWEPVPEERQRYLARTDNCEEKSVFLIGCGAFGLSVSTNTGGGEPVSSRPMAK